MKRLLIFLGAGAFLLCIVTPLFAQQVDIKSTGWIRVRYRDWNDFLMDDNLAANTTSGRNRHYFDTRIRMGVAANIEPGLKGVIEIERTDDWGTHSVFNGNPAPSDSTALGTPGGTDSIYFRQAWVDWAIPGTPIHIVGGRMLYTVGGSIVFSGVDNGVDGIQVYSQLGPGTLTGYYFKPQNGGTVTATAGPTGVVTTTSTGDRRFANNDFDMFGGSYKFEWSARNGVEVYGLYSLDKQRAKTIALAATPGICTGAPGDCEQTEEYYIGANFFGVQGPFTYRLEGAYQGGTARKNVNANAASAAGDVDRSAGMVVGGVSYALVPELALNLDGGYASLDNAQRWELQFMEGTAVEARYDALAEHASAGEYRAIVQAAGGRLYGLGLALAVLYYVPLVNLLAPMLSALAFTHLCLGELESLRQRMRDS